MRKRSYGFPVTLTLVPEPAAALLLLAGTTAALNSRRQRQEA